MTIQYRPQTARRGFAGTVTALLAAVATCLLFAGPAAAASALPATSRAAVAGANTVTVELTDSGPAPDAISIHAGDSVRFINTMHPGLVAVASVSITITDATQSPFTLPAGAAATVGPYDGLPDPQTIRYTATYNTSIANGLIPAGSQRNTGDISVVPALPPTCNPKHACPQPDAAR